MSDAQPPITEDLDATSDDPGGVPFDDELPDDGSDGDAGRGDGPGYDSAKLMQQRGIGYPGAIPQGMNVLKEFVMGHWGGTNLGILSKPPAPDPRRVDRQPAQLGHGVGLALGQPGPRPRQRRSGDRVLHQPRGRDRHPSGARLRHRPLLAQQQGLAATPSRARRPGSASRGPSGCTSSARGRRPTWRRRSVQTPPPPPPAAKNDPATPTNLLLPSTSLQVGSVGADVARLQDFLRFFKFAAFTRSDGQFGPRTKGAVETAQTNFAAKKWYLAKIDGEWGPKSNAAAAQFLQAAGK